MPNKDHQKKNNAEVIFVYADVNNNVKLRLHNSIGNKYVYEFKSKKVIMYSFLLLLTNLIGKLSSKFKGEVLNS